MNVNLLIGRINQLTVALFVSITTQAALRVENNRLRANLAALEEITQEYVGRCKWGV